MRIKVLDHFVTDLNDFFFVNLDNIILLKNYKFFHSFFVNLLNDNFPHNIN